MGVTRGDQLGEIWMLQCVNGVRPCPSLQRVDSDESKKNQSRLVSDQHVFTSKGDLRKCLMFLYVTFKYVNHATYKLK